uniref:Uncharacterized protein n=1 Tax=Rhizophora mucronata TaxID=61149 RepID=A0A2P2QYH0_RHIMU
MIKLISTKQRIKVVNSVVPSEVVVKEEC